MDLIDGQGIVIKTIREGSDHNVLPENDTIIEGDSIMVVFKEKGTSAGKIAVAVCSKFDKNSWCVTQITQNNFETIIKMFEKVKKEFDHEQKS